MSFRHFLDQLYCSGSEERMCVLPGGGTAAQPGECLWFDSKKNPVNAAHMANRPSWAGDKWDPVLGKAISPAHWKEFDGKAATSCVQQKHFYLVGESTTRDLYYNFADFVGIKADRSYCMNIHGALCQKTKLSSDGRTRMSYQFISAANASKEIAIAHNLTAQQPPDAVFIYCMMYDWLGPLMKGDDPAMGEACMGFVERAIVARFPTVPVYMLGPIYPPGWVSAPYSNRTHPNSNMARIFRSVNLGMGFSCVRRSEAGADGRRGANDYKVISTKGIRGPIDRYNVVGHRKRDMIHPYDNAHRPVIQMMLNLACPGGAGYESGNRPAADETRGHVA